MEAPKCRSCGKRHWGNCEQVLDSRVRFVEPLEEACPHCGKKASEPVAGGFDKKAYQREYMRRKRAQSD